MIRVVKEAEEGFDSLLLGKLQKQIEDAIAVEFSGKHVVLPIQGVIKGREVMLECADLIAGGMQRRALACGRNPKDRLAEAVLNVTGFEDVDDQGALFKYYATRRR